MKVQANSYQKMQFWNDLELKNQLDCINITIPQGFLQKSKISLLIFVKYNDTDVKPLKILGRAVSENAIFERFGVNKINSII